LTDAPNTRTQMLCLWCGPVAILLWLGGFAFLAEFIQPLHPGDSAEEIAREYQSGTDGIRAGLLLTMVGATLTGPWVAAITTQLKRIEGRYSPLAYTQLGLGMGGILLFIIPVMNMQTAAFRPDRDPDLILLANDLGWIPFVGVWSMAAVQNLAIAIAIFQDSDQKVFPRWVGYFNLWIVTLFTPGSLLYFFKDGPFAWDGLLSWWVVVVAFCAWFVVMFFAMRKAIKGQALEEGSAREPAPVLEARR
jgi:hypothetical protein